MRTRQLFRFLWVLPLAGLVFHAFLRPWSQDESTYILIPKLIRESGLFPYRDIAYPQMPLYPLLIALWQIPFGTSFEVHRALSAVLLIVLTVWMFREKSIGPWGALLFATNPLVWDYFVLVKPYVHTTLLTFLAILCLRNNRSFLAGMGMSAAVFIRHLFLPLAVFLPFIEWKKGFVRYVLGGLAIGSVAFAAYLWCGEAFLFNVFKMHTVKGSGGKIWDIASVVHQTWQTFKEPAQMLLGLSFLVSSIFLLKQRSAWVWPVSAVAIVLPTLILRPFYDEYWAAAVPFMAITVAVAVQLSGQRKILAGLACFAAVAGGVRNVQSVHHDVGVLKGEGLVMNDVSEVRRVGERISALTRPEDSILTFWSGYALVSNRAQVRGVETGIHVKEMAGRITPEESKRFHILTPQEVVEAVEKKIPALVVIGLASPKGLEEITQKHYHLAEDVAGARLYVR